jgi:hypothetical protein
LKVQRQAPGKAQALILDFAGNVCRHGLPDAAREWSLEAKPRRQRAKPDAPRLRKCPTCSALNRPGAHECAACGADLRTPKERREVEIRLEQARRREAMAKLRVLPKARRLAWAGADERRLELIAEIRGYKRGWVHFARMEALERMGGRA